MFKKVLLLLPIFSFDLVHSQNDGNHEMVSMVQLLATPEKYHNKIVTIVGVGWLKFEENQICLTRDHLRAMATKNCFWLGSFEEEKWDSELLMKIKEFNGSYVKVTGRFNGQDMGHLNLFAGSISDVSAYSFHEPEFGPSM